MKKETVNKIKWKYLRENTDSFTLVHIWLLSFPLYIYLSVHKYPFCLVSLVLLRKTAANRKRNVSTSSETRFFKYRTAIYRHSKQVVKEIPLCNYCPVKHTYVGLSCTFPISFNPIRKKTNPTTQQTNNKQLCFVMFTCQYSKALVSFSYWTHGIIDYRMEYISMLW